MEQNRLEFIQSIEEQKAQHQRHIDDVKVEAENRLSMVHSNLEMQLSIQKVRIEATEKERMANLSNMSIEFKTFMADMIRQHVELESISSQRWQEITNQNTLNNMRLSKFIIKVEESTLSHEFCPINIFTLDYCLQKSAYIKQHIKLLIGEIHYTHTNITSFI